jgi:hypothetical protein
MANGPQRTVLAQEAFKFNDVFGIKFAVQSFGSTVKRRLKLSEPEMSTDGGRKARQPITLMTEEEGGRSIVVGWVDVPRKLAELRSFNVAKEQYEARYQSSIDVPREEWERAVSEIIGFFRIQQIETSVVDTAVRATDKQKAKIEKVAAPADPSITLALVMLAIGVLIGFGLGYLVFRLNIFM